MALLSLLLLPNVSLAVCFVGRSSSSAVREKWWGEMFICVGGADGRMDAFFILLQTAGSLIEMLHATHGRALRCDLRERDDVFVCYFI